MSATRQESGRTIRRRKSTVAVESGAAVLAAQIDIVGDECRRAADVLSRGRTFGRSELETCVRLSKSLAATQQFLKTTVAQLAFASRKRATRSQTG